METKNRYIVDGKNHLLVKRNRKVLLTDGRFSIDRNNRLIYWLNEPKKWRKEYNLPAKISFIGNWHLTPNYDLELSLRQTKQQYKADSLVLKGEIISTDRDALVFEITSQDKDGLSHTQVLKLTGRWQTDEFNQIKFTLKKKTVPDTFVFEGDWQINRNQQIVYNYEKTNLKTKTKSIYTLFFDGFWQINSANRIVYILTHSTISYFDFRVQIESPNLYPEEGIIKYRLGIGSKKTRLYQTKTIFLYGAWKFSHKLGLTFQVDYGAGKFQGIEFGVKVYLNKNNETTFLLTNKKQEPLGLTIVFTKSFLKERDAQIFLRLKQMQKERGIEAGLRLPF